MSFRMLHLAPHQCFFPHLCLSPPSTLPPIQPPFALVSSVREGGKISLKKKKNKSSLSMEVTLSSHSTQVSKSNHPIFPASTPAIFSLAVNTVHSSFCLLTFYTRVRPTKKSCRCVNRKDNFFSFIYFFFLHFWMCPHSPDSELTVSRFGNQSKRKNFSIHLVDGIQSRDSFHPECLRRPRHSSAAAASSVVMFRGGLLCDTSISAMYN